MLKVGDKVRVIKGLKRFRNSKVGITKDMLQFEEEIVTIIGVEELGDILVYSIKEDEEEYYWAEEMFEKIEGNNMKELTFREVIANIKKGEVWEDGNKIIKCTEGAICIETKDGVAYNGFEFLDQGLYRLQRPQYTFQEAFEAFEEGKEIESCVTSYTFRKIDDYIEVWDKTEGERRYLEFDEMFSLEEIRNKWYIND